MRGLPVSGKIKKPNPVHKLMMQSRKFRQQVIPGKKKSEPKRVADNKVKEYKEGKDET